MAKQIETRPKVAITLKPETLQAIDRLAAAWGQSRSAVIEKFLGYGVQAISNSAEGSSWASELPEVCELFQRFFVYNDRVELTMQGYRMGTYDFPFEHMPPELQNIFYSAGHFEHYRGTRIELEDQEKLLERELARVKANRDDFARTGGKKLKGGTRGASRKQTSKRKQSDGK